MRFYAVHRTFSVLIILFKFELPTSLVPLSSRHLNTAATTWLLSRPIISHAVIPPLRFAQWHPHPIPGVHHVQVFIIPDPT